MIAQEEQQQPSPFGATAAVSTLLISYRGEKVEMPLVPGKTVIEVKRAILKSLLQTAEDSSDGDGSRSSSSKNEGVLLLQPCDLKLMLKGKLLKNDDEDLYQTLVLNNNAKKTLQKVYRIMATGVSQTEATRLQNDQANAPRIRDDLSIAGKREIARRQRLGRQVLQQSAAAETRNKRPFNSNNIKIYGFGKIQTLPNLANEAQAHQILTSLANDPGILACMAKHQWQVGSLSELYPDGNVGQSAVCVMGLNRNAGQEILLRLRTDDLQGFRKIASIRQVLYHELAHNVHSAHDAKFFHLMRQVERECQELDWTHGAGLTMQDDHDDNSQTTAFQGGTYRLGGGGGGVEGLESSPQQHQHSFSSKRELAARAAISRMTAEEEKEIENGCASCGLRAGDLFLPNKYFDDSCHKKS